MEDNTTITIFVVLLCLIAVFVGIFIWYILGYELLGMFIAGCGAAFGSLKMIYLVYLVDKRFE